MGYGFGSWDSDEATKRRSIMRDRTHSRLRGVTLKVNGGSLSKDRGHPVVSD